MKIVLASNNSGKIRELNALLSRLAIEVIPQQELGVNEIEETGVSFVENALLKARHASHVTGLPAIADDSGLCVRALNGAPGIYSARYAGEPSNAEANIQKLLLDMQHIPENQRQAFFYCVLVFVTSANDPTPLICEGKWSGTILKDTQGIGGFGYDPIFYVPTQKKSAAELPLETKNKLSHRGIALHGLLTKLQEKWDGSI